MKKNKSAIWTVVLVGAAATAVSTWAARADDPVSERRKVATYEKAIAQDQLKISSTQVDLKTEQTVLKRDIAQYGADSSQARSDRDKVRDIRKTLADQKADLQRDISKKQAQASGQVPAEDLIDSK